MSHNECVSAGDVERAVRHWELPSGISPCPQRFFARGRAEDRAAGPMRFLRFYLTSAPEVVWRTPVRRSTVLVPNFVAYLSISKVCLLKEKPTNEN